MRIIEDRAETGEGGSGIINKRKSGHYVSSHLPNDDKVQHCLSCQNTSKYRNRNYFCHSCFINALKYKEHYPIIVYTMIKYFGLARVSVLQSVVIKAVD